MPPAFQRREHHEQIGHAIALVFVIVTRLTSGRGGKVKTRTLANLSDWPYAKIEALRRVLKGETALVSADALRIERLLPHGHVAAVLRSPDAQNPISLSRGSISMTIRLWPSQKSFGLRHAVNWKSPI